MAEAGGDRQLRLLGRDYCHLCHDMAEVVVPLAESFGFQVVEVDVDAHPELEERWGEWVPVLLHGDRELCHYHADVPAIRAYLAGIS